MTYEVDGKQYIAIALGLGAISRPASRNSPELKSMRNATMLFVFGL